MNEALPIILVLISVYLAATVPEPVMPKGAPVLQVLKVRWKSFLLHPGAHAAIALMIVVIAWM